MTRFDFISGIAASCVITAIGVCFFAPPIESVRMPGLILGGIGVAAGLVRLLILSAVSLWKPEDINAGTSLTADLEMDTLMLLDAMNMPEDSFGITIPDRDLRGFVTAGDIVAYLDARS